MMMTVAAAPACLFYIVPAIKSTSNWDIKPHMITPTCPPHPHVSLLSRQVNLCRVVWDPPRQQHPIQACAYLKEP